VSLAIGILRAWTRSSEFTITMDGNYLDAFTFYKRDFTATNGPGYDISIARRGAELHSNGLWFIGGVVLNENERFVISSNLGGFLFETKDNKGIFEYDSAWDYYVDASEAYCVKMLIRSGTSVAISFRKIFDTYSSNNLEYTEFQGTEHEDEPASETIRKSVANLNIDNDYDVDEWSDSVAGSASEQSIEIKPPFHNLLQIYDIDDWKRFNGRQGRTVNQGIITVSQIRYTQRLNCIILTLDNLPVFYGFLKIHEHVSVDTGLTRLDYFYSNDELIAAFWTLAKRTGVFLISSTDMLYSMLFHIQSLANTALRHAKPNPIIFQITKS
jgi:hypothetical protein